MEVLADLDRGVVELLQPDDVGRFSVVVIGGTRPDRVQELLGAREVGRLADDAGDHAWVAVRWIRREAVGRVDGAWEQSFETMLETARDHGWVDATGNFVKAHVEYGSD